MIVAIPSKGRAGKITSHRHVEDPILFVPETEGDAYVRAYPDNAVVAVPSSVRGITATRNWILDFAIECGDPYVTFVDDDVITVGWVKLYVDRGRPQKLTPAEVSREFSVLHDLAEQMGFTVWGAATQAALRSVYPYRPLIFRTYVTASCMGMRADRGIRFDESFPVKEDYELCLRMIRDEGGVLGARYFHWQNEHWGTEGGCKDYRTVEMEEAAIARLQERYPGWVRAVQRGGSSFSVELLV